MNALDDPLIGTKVIDKEVFKQNPNMVLTTTKKGGHMGYAESFCGTDQWFTNPILDFFDVYVG